MPSALRASRDFVAHALAAARAGVEKGERNASIEGPDIKVEPFDAHNVTTEAGLIKLGASIGAARRARANFEANQQDAELAREFTRARIAEVRAQGKYYEGTGRQASTGSVLSQDVGPYKAGTPLGTVNAGLSHDRLTESRASEERRNLRIGKVTAAQAGLKQIDAAAQREAKSKAQAAFEMFAPDFQAAVGSDKDARDKAVRGLGINVEDWNKGIEIDRVAMLAAARKRIMQDLEGMATEQVSKDYQPHRDKYQSIIDQGVEGFGDEGMSAPAGGADQGDPNDPLGLGSFEGQ